MQQPPFPPQQDPMYSPPEGGMGQQQQQQQQQSPELLGYRPYTPPGGGGGRPLVIAFFRVYAGMVLLLYAGFGVMWFGMGTMPHGRNDLPLTVFMLAILLLFGGFFAVSAFIPYKPWGWTIGLIAICFGLMGCTAIFAIPLIIYWMKPETKAAFGRM